MQTAARQPHTWSGPAPSVAVFRPRMSFSIFLRWLANSPASCSIISFLQGGRGRRRPASGWGAGGGGRRLSGGAARRRQLQAAGSLIALPAARLVLGVATKSRSPPRCHFCLACGQEGGGAGRRWSPGVRRNSLQSPGRPAAGSRPPAQAPAGNGFSLPRTCSENLRQPAPMAANPGAGLDCLKRAGLEGCWRAPVPACLRLPAAAVSPLGLHRPLAEQCWSLD